MTQQPDAGILPPGGLAGMTDSLRRRIVANIKARMVAARWVRADGKPNRTRLVAETGLSWSLVSDLLADKRTPTLDTLQTIAKALGCDVGDLVR